MMNAEWHWPAADPQIKPVLESSRPCPWPRGVSRTVWYVLSIGLKDSSPQVLSLGLGDQVLGLGLDLEAQVLGFGLGDQVLAQYSLLCSSWSTDIKLTVILTLTLTLRAISHWREYSPRVLARKWPRVLAGEYSRRVHRSHWHEINIARDLWWSATIKFKWYLLLVIARLYM